MPIFNIRKFLNENYADDQAAELHSFTNQPQPIECMSCDGTGRQGDDKCSDCGGYGELHEDGTDRPTGLTFAREIAQDMIDGGMIATSDENFNDLYDIYVERYSNEGGLPSSMRAEVKAEYIELYQSSISESDGDHGAVKETARQTRLTQAQEIAQDMIDGRMIATSLENFNELYAVHMNRYPTWGYPDQLRDYTLTAYRRLLRQYHGGVYRDGMEELGSDDSGEVNEMFGTGSAGYRVFDVNEIVFDDLMGWFPEAKTSHDVDAETATILFKDGVTDEIDAKMDRFNSNWMTKSMTINRDDVNDDNIENTLDETGDMFAIALAELKEQAGITEDPDNRSKAERKASAYRAGWSDSKDSDGEDRSDLKTNWGPTGDDYQRGYKDYQDSMSTSETAPQGKAPGAQVKGNEDVPDQSGVLKYGQPHKLSGRLVGEDSFENFGGNFAKEVAIGVAKGALGTSPKYPETSDESQIWDYMRDYIVDTKGQQALSVAVIKKAIVYYNEFLNNMWTDIDESESEDKELQKMRENAGYYSDRKHLGEEPNDGKAEDHDEFDPYDTEYGLEADNRENIFRRAMGWDDEDQNKVEDDDGFIQDNTRGGYDASVDQQFIGNYGTQEEAAEAIKEAKGPDFLPSIWFIDDHGGITLWEDDLEEQLLGEYGDWDNKDESKFANSFNDWDEQQEYDEDEEEYYEGDESVTIKGKLPYESYWNHRGKHQDKIEPLEALLPASEEVEDWENNLMLERFRRSANVYYDIYNNGAWNTGNGQRGAEFEELFDLGPGHTIDTDDLEELIDDTVMDAWNEQSGKGTVSEEFLHEEGDKFDTGYNDEELHRQETDFGGDDTNVEFDTGYNDEELHRQETDLEFNENGIGLDDEDMGDDVVVTPGQLVQIDSKLGGEASVIAQRSGYIVVNLPKGGMKLLRDDEWWIDDDEEEFGGDEYADVEGGYEEPEELAFDESITEDQAAVMPAHSQDDRQNVFFSQMGEGYTIMPPMDPKYIERDGLEGPFSTYSGKVVYYDQQEGKYYDPDSDIYLTHDEYEAYNKNPNIEYPEYKKPAPAVPAPRERGRMDETHYDSKRYPRRDHEGLSGPFLAGSGKVYYIDVNTGEYYDPDEDTSMDYTDFKISDEVDEGKYGVERERLPDYSKQSTSMLKTILSGLHPDEGMYKKLIQKELRSRTKNKKGENVNEAPSAMKKAGKWIKRGMQGWDSGYSDPDDMVKRHQEYSDEELNFLLDKPGAEKGKFSTNAAKLQQKLVKRNLRKRGHRDFKKYMDETGYDAEGEASYEPSDRMRQKMDRELGHERAWNNFQIFIDGKPWKVVANSNHASAIVKTLQRKGKTASYGETMAPVSEGLKEGKWDYKDSSKGKGAGTDSPMYDGGAKNRKSRKAFRKAEKKRKHQAMMRGEKWAQEKVPEAVVPYDGDSKGEYKWLDNETGEVTREHPDVEAAREKEARRAHLATEPENDISDMWYDEKDHIKKVGWDAIGDFGDVAGGGGDPIDFIMQKYDFSMKDIDAAAVEQGYADAGEWADSYTDENNFSEGYNKGQTFSLKQAIDEFRSSYGDDIYVGYSFSTDDRKRTMHWIEFNNGEMLPANDTIPPKGWPEYKHGQGNEKRQWGSNVGPNWGETKVDEGGSDFKKGSKKKGGGYNKPGSVKQKKASSKQSRQDSKQAVTIAPETEDWWNDTANSDADYLQGIMAKMKAQKKASSKQSRQDDKQAVNEYGAWGYEVGDKVITNYGTGEIIEDNGLQANKGVSWFLVLMLDGEHKGREYSMNDSDFKALGEGFEDMNIDITSIPKTKDNELKTDGKIVVKSKSGKIFTFSDEDEAEMHFGSFGWNHMKKNDDWEVTYPEVNELETATDKLDADRELGEPTIAAEPVDSDAELAGMQQLIKNVMQEPDQDMEDAIQTIANPEDPAVELGNDEIAQLKNLLGLFK